MLKVGLTGGIGAGKSTVLLIFQSLGIPVYKADDRAKWLINHNSDIKHLLSNEFGSDIYNEGQINTSYLSNIVFKDPEKLNRLNSIVHPKVAEDFISWCSKQNAKYIVKEAAILIESGAYQQLDKVILVTADKHERIKRIMTRDQITEEEVMQRVRNQMSDEEKVHFSDYIVENNNQDSLIEKINKIHQELLSM
jgi:dephospho-CoA kinase